MRDLHPTHFRDALRRSLGDYIATSLAISSRFPELRERVRAILADPSTTLVKGPFVEAMPDFEKGRSLRQLVEAGVQNGDHLIVYPEVVAGRA